MAIGSSSRNMLRSMVGNSVLPRGLPSCGSPIIPRIAQPLRRTITSTPSPRSRPSSPRLRDSSANTAQTPVPDYERARQAMIASRDRMYQERRKRNSSALLYWTGGGLLALGMAYASVPLYRAFCTDSGVTGKPISDPARFAPDRLYADPEPAVGGRKRINVRFEATASDVLPWDFAPVTRNVKVLPGETALAFYTATNKGDKDLIGIATYNITPEKVAPYFAKVECFCFEEQKIRAGEEVDLPVFFFIDRDIADDPAVGRVEDVVLNYTFFRAKRNDRGHLVPDASEDEVQRSQGFENYELAQKV